ncbi:MAG: VWA domain-containing protein, partial [Marinirhabdus sp.]|nr:VWA domain-containing protein [Marinirhabdus sp.]
LFSDEIELFIPPKKGKSHVLRIIRELLEFQPKSRKTDLSNALKYLTNVMKKKAIVFVLSDFMTDNYRDTLKIVAGKHDVTGIRVYDRREEEVPNLGMVQMQDEETGELMLVNTNSKAVRRNYSNYYHERAAYFQDAFTKSGAGAISCRVDESYVKKLLGYFKRR